MSVESPPGPREGREPFAAGTGGGKIGLSDVAGMSALAGATLLLYLALEQLPLFGGWVALLGTVVGLFAPAPAVHVFLRWGARFGALALAGVSLVLGLSAGWEGALHFLASIGVIAWLLSAAILSGRSVEAAVAWSVVGVSVGVGVLYASGALGVDGERVVSVLGPEMDEAARRIPGTLSGIDRAEFNRMIRILGRLLPAVAVMQATLIALLNYTLIRHVWTARGSGALFPPRELGRWSMPEPAVWALIACGVMMFVLRGGGLFWGVGNFLLVLLFGYFLQGLAIFHFWFRRHGVAVPFRLPVYFLAVAFSYAVAAFGLFDLWFDFRKIRPAGPPSDRPDGGGNGGGGGAPS